MMPRKQQVSYFSDDTAAIKAAERFMANYVARRATAEVFQLTTVDTKTKIFMVIMEWDADGPRSRADGSGEDVRTKIYPQQSGNVSRRGAPRRHRRNQNKRKAPKKEEG